MSDIHPFILLRRAIRQTGTQYRKNNDNSTSLFNPDQGFIYAYNIPAVEVALNAYEATLPVEFLDQVPPATLEEQVLEMAGQISQDSPSMASRDFARTVMAYVAEQNAVDSKSAEVLSLLSRLTDEDDTSADD